MKILKSILTSFLTLILTLLISVLIVSITFKDLLIEDILYEGFKSTIINKDYKEKNLTLNDIINEDGVITDNDFVNEILESPEIKELVNKYLDKIITTIADENVSVDELNEFNLNQDMINYIKENKEVLSEKTGIEITDEMIEEASEKIEEIDTKKIVKQTVENVRNNLSPQEKQLLKAYNFITSSSLKIYLIIGIIITLLLIAIIKKSLYKWIRNLSNAMILAGTATLIISKGFEIIISKMIQVQEIIKLESMSTLSMKVLICGVIVYIIYKLISIFIVKENKNEVSKVSE